MEPLSLLIWAAVWAGVSACLYVTVYFLNLTFQILVDWFRTFAYLMVENDRRAIRDRDKIFFSATQLKKAIANDDFNVVHLNFNSLQAKGEFNVIQGIFDQKAGEIYDARVIKAGSVDEKIKEAHSYGRKEVALWI
jgi:hypothetical protein